MAYFRGGYRVILIKIVRGMLTVGLMCVQNFLRNPDSKKGIKMIKY